MRFENMKQAVLHLVQAWGLRIVKGAHAGKNLMRAVGEPWRQFCGIGMGQGPMSMLVHGDVALQPGLGPVLGGVLAFHPVVHRTEGVVRERGSLPGQGQPEGVVLGEVFNQDLGARSRTWGGSGQGPKAGSRRCRGGWWVWSTCGGRSQTPPWSCRDWSCCPFDAVWWHPVVGVQGKHICNASLSPATMPRFCQTHLPPTSHGRRVCRRPPTPRRSLGRSARSNRPTFSRSWRRVDSKE